MSISNESGTPVIDDQLDGDQLKEECGVFGVYAGQHDVARLTFFGLQALQHRGQESAGIATSDGSRVQLRKQLGLVAQVFDESDLRLLTGDRAVGHTRYSTTGVTNRVNAGPIAVSSDIGTIVVAHNGNIVNSMDLRDEVVSAGITLQTTTDSEALSYLIALAPGDTIVEKLKTALPKCVGAYSLVVMGERELVAVRDPHGIRPLCLGKLDDGWVVASESCALDSVGATFERELEPSEILTLGPDGLVSDQIQPPGQLASCIFEFIYFARPDSALLGERLYLARQRMGEELARENPIEADVVVPAPDGAIPAAIGYSRASGIPYSDGLIKNRYIGRTFIQPDSRLRQLGVQLKFNAIPEVVGGKRVILIDDSIVRGTTSRPIVDMLRNAGATEVHFRVHSPPIKHPCYLGVDMATHEELIASDKSVEEIAEIIGADSLAYLSLDGLVRATRNPRSSFCHACLTGEYPVPVQNGTDKFAFEKKHKAPDDNFLSPNQAKALESREPEVTLVGRAPGSSRGGESN